MTTHSCEKPVNPSAEIWDGMWPRDNPHRDIYLCESSWNAGDWQHHCSHGFCECLRCNREHTPGKRKLTREELWRAGQAEINVEPITIRRDS
jgi:hypothetical protein